MRSGSHSLWRRGEFCPRIGMTFAEQTLASFSRRDWLSSNVRCLAWHMHIFKLAVAGLDDVVRIYSKDSNPTATVVLKVSPAF